MHTPFPPSKPLKQLLRNGLQPRAMYGNLRPAQESLWVQSPPGPEWSLRGSGTYLYSNCSAGESRFTPSSVVEHYSHWGKEGAPERLTRSSRDARSTPHGIELRVEQLLSIHSPRKLTFQVLDRSNTCLQQKEYQRVQGGLQWAKASSPSSRGGGAKLSLSDGALLLPLTRNYLGPVIMETASREGGKAPIVVPEFTDPNVSTVFDPELTIRTAKRASLQPEEISVDGVHWNCHAYQFIGGPYGPESIFWICPNSRRLIRYIFMSPKGERWRSELVGATPQ